MTMNFYPTIIEYSDTKNHIYKATVCIRAQALHDADRNDLKNQKDYKEITFFVSNPNDIPAWMVEEKLPVIVKLHEDDQFCRFVGTMMYQLDIESIIPQ